MIFKRCIGRAMCENNILQYYVFGDLHGRYGIEIEYLSIESSRMVLGTKLMPMLRFGRKLCRGKVFPHNLQEIANDEEK